MIWFICGMPVLLALTGWFLILAAGYNRKADLFRKVDITLPADLFHARMYEIEKKWPRSKDDKKCIAEYEAAEKRKREAQPE